MNTFFALLVVVGIMFGIYSGGKQSREEQNEQAAIEQSVETVDGGSELTDHPEINPRD